MSIESTSIESTSIESTSIQTPGRSGRSGRSARTSRRVRIGALAVAAFGGSAWAPADAGAVGLASELVRGRAATVDYVFDVDAAMAAGYQIITPNMPRMGYHYLNPTITEFDITKPPILVYVDVDGTQQLAAFEWVWPETPAEPPLEGATYGSFAAACHYADGTFIAAGAEADCAPTNPEGDSAFGFWHPDLVTMHVWLWYPNPDGLFTGENPLVDPITGVGASHNAGHIDPASRECADVSGVGRAPRCR